MIGWVDDGARTGVSALVVPVPLVVVVLALLGLALDRQG